MITEQFQIIDACLGKDLTINQISKIIKKSYAFTNKYTHELIHKNILKKKIIGPSILCSLNYNNEETIACLVYNSIKKSSELDKKIESKAKIVLMHKKKLHYIKNTLPKELDFSQIYVLKGHEKFWRMAAKVMG